MDVEELREKASTPEFQQKCWKVLADILKDEYNIKIKVGVKNEEKKEDQMGKR